ncbi:MAG: hypothetical protein HY815_30590 [Candidatus Riflebacteria bacterium]|nr:hypothetical protein [Candidatus Riflebacteria bacterium]
MGPLYVVHENVYRMRLVVANRTAARADPRFWVVGGSTQPLPWKVEAGPTALEPGESGRFTIAAIVPTAEFNLTRGARLMVALGASYDLRSGVLVEGDAASRNPDAVPNGAFRYWETEADRPAFWGIVREGADGASVQPPVAVDSDPDAALEFRFPPAAGRSTRLLACDTQLPLPDHPIEVRVRLPAAANRFPDPPLVYGLRVVLDEKPYLVLFGDRDETGWLERAPYRMVKAPRERWSSHSLDLGPTLVQLGATVGRTRQRLERFPNLDYPVAAIRLQLMVSTNRLPDPVIAWFGPVTSRIRRPDPERMADRAVRTPWELDLWSGARNFELRNFEKAFDDLTRAVAANPCARNQYALGEAALWAGHLARSRDAFRVAVAAGHELPLAYKGLGWACYGLGDDAGALEAFRMAYGLLESRASDSDRLHVADVLKGMAYVHARRRECRRVLELVATMEALAPDLLLPPGNPVEPCRTGQVEE